MKFARVEEGKVVEIIEAPRTVDGVTFELHELYHESLVATMHECGEDTAVGDDFQVPIETADVDTGNGEPPPK